MTSSWRAGGADELEARDVDPAPVGLGPIGGVGVAAMSAASRIQVDRVLRQAL